MTETSTTRDVILEIIEKHGLNKNLLCERLEVTANTVTNLISGQTKRITPTLARKIHGAFPEYSIADLRAAGTYEEPEPQPTQVIINQFKPEFHAGAVNNICNGPVTFAAPAAVAETSEEPEERDAREAASEVIDELFAREGQTRRLRVIRDEIRKNRTSEQ